MKNINFYIYGTCNGNPGPGGAAVLAVVENEYPIYHYGRRYHRTTKTRMELMALIMALEYINGFGDINSVEDPARVITVFFDNLSFVRIINGDLKVKSDKDLWSRVFQLIGAIKSTYPETELQFSNNYWHDVYYHDKKVIDIVKMALMSSRLLTLADDGYERELFTEALNAPVRSPNPRTKEEFIDHTVAEVVGAVQSRDDKKVRAALVKLYDFAYAKGWDNGQAEFIPE